MILYGIFCFVCLLGLWHSARLTRYFRLNHPSDWEEFGFSGNGWYSKAKDEAIDLKAGQRFRSFIRSDARRNLRDAKLDQMIFIGRLINYSGAVLFVMVIANWIFFGSQFSPGI